MYSAPERSNKSDMRKVDVWAIGCVLYELCSGGQRLFRWTSEQEKYMQLSQLFSGSWTPPPLPANVAGWQEVVDAMLTVEPALRPLPSDVLRLGIFRCARRGQLLHAHIPSAYAASCVSTPVLFRDDVTWNRDSLLARVLARSKFVRRSRCMLPLTLVCRACSKMYFRHTGASAGTGHVRRSLVLPARVDAAVPCKSEVSNGPLAKADGLQTAVTL